MIRFRHAALAVVLLPLAAGPAAADMTVAFTNDSSYVVEWIASPSSVPHALGAASSTTLPLTRDPVTVRVSQSFDVVCEGVATFSQVTGMPGNCEMSLTRSAGSAGLAQELMCVAFAQHPGGSNCTAGVRVVPKP